MTDTPGNGDDDAPLDDEAGLERLITHLARTRGFDFSGYKRRSLARRIRRRMSAIEVPTFADYVDHLEVRPDEFQSLFDMLLINVTSFFRDPLAWDALQGHLVRLLAGKPHDAPIRVWSAGCATGEEPYTIAMLLAEQMGLPHFVQRVKIYATDIDESALREARLAFYKPKVVEHVPPALLEKYFVKQSDGYVFDKDLRRSVIFGGHDLVKDAPISRVDLLTCRNALMYFNAETQSRILGRMHFALTSDGLLFLGKAEMLLMHSNLFTPVDLPYRIFQRSSRTAKSRERVVQEDPAVAVRRVADEQRRSLDHLAFENSSVAQVVVDSGGRLSLLNYRATVDLGLAFRDRGRPFHDLELSYRPTELRSYIDQVRASLRPVRIKDVERTSPSGDKTWLDIELSPLLEGHDVCHGVLLAFFDVSHSHRLDQELQRVTFQLEAAQQEVQSAGEELETTNEELQSTVEELETTNEELQSTNEELETMNEELQSTNEELHTINDELRDRSEALNRTNTFYGAVLASLRVAVAVLDGALLVRTWNPAMADLWGLRADEVEGKHFLNLDIGLPLAELRHALRAGTSSAESSEVVVDCTNRRGRAIRCRVAVSPLPVSESNGVILFIEELGPR